MEEIEVVGGQLLLAERKNPAEKKGRSFSTQPACRGGGAERG